MANELGLNIDMTDVDRLRDWARNIEDGGLLITRWASPEFLVYQLRQIADRMEREIREVGQLRRCPDAVAVRIAQRVAELPDRSSPNEWPEAMLVTSAELQFIVTDEINEAMIGIGNPASNGTSGPLRSEAL